jgi:hypothetical protein
VRTRAVEGLNMLKWRENEKTNRNQMNGSLLKQTCSINPEVRKLTNERIQAKICPFLSRRFIFVRIFLFFLFSNFFVVEGFIECKQYKVTTRSLKLILMEVLGYFFFFSPKMTEFFELFFKDSCNTCLQAIEASKERDGEHSCKSTVCGACWADTIRFHLRNNSLVSTPFGVACPSGSCAGVER